MFSFAVTHWVVFQWRLFSQIYVNIGQKKAFLPSYNVSVTLHLRTLGQLAHWKALKGSTHTSLLWWVDDKHCTGDQLADGLKHWVSSVHMAPLENRGTGHVLRYRVNINLDSLGVIFDCRMGCHREWFVILCFLAKTSPEDNRYGPRWDCWTFGGLLGRRGGNLASHAVDMKRFPKHNDIFFKATTSSKRRSPKTVLGHVKKV